ncbi:macrophage mannose receptor 1-like [Lineus longissimus]|uniref:macrophage mannose receptor 1-like n=1 Tax=Lineus longissimus TaxID=88925 RepID=UPI002B4F19F3
METTLAILFAVLAVQSSLIDAYLPECPSDYFTIRSSCYKFINGFKWYNDARMVCAQNMGSLIELQTKTQTQLLLDYMQTNLRYFVDHTRTDIWLGGFKQENPHLWPERKWVWLSNRTKLLDAYQYTNWEGQKSVAEEKRYCLSATYNNLKWMPRNCNSELSYFCQIIRKHAWFTTTKERYPPCPAGFIRFGTSCYKFLYTHQRHSDARLDCSKHMGDLVKIESKEENEFLLDYIKTNLYDVPLNGFWIGADRFDWRTQYGAVWVWLSDNKLLNQSRFSNWGSGEPHKDTSRNCLYVDHNDLKWLGSVCNVKRQAICEIQLKADWSPNDPTKMGLRTCDAPNFRYDVSASFAVVVLALLNVCLAWS